ncbi:MAG TPA: hypothetical protein VF102_07765 [Gemmatimonadaceae bacterium]
MAGLLQLERAWGGTLGESGSRRRLHRGPHRLVDARMQGAE